MQNQSNAEQFLKLPYDLLAANSFVSSNTGEIVEITMQQKVIYCWMKQRCEFFTRENKEYYDTLDSVANELSIDRKTVMRAITFFTKHGVLFAEKRKATATRQKWFFKRFNNLMLVQPDKPTQKRSVSPVAQRSIESNTNAQPDVYVESETAGQDWVNESIPCEDYEGIQFSIEAESSSYEDWESTEVETAAAPAKVEVSDIKIDLSSMPLSRWNRNGREISDQLFDWFEDNGFYIEDCRTGQVFHNSSKQRYVMSGKDLIPLPDNVASLDEQDESILPF